jgi:hypothetical protein
VLATFEHAKRRDRGHVKQKREEEEKKKKKGMKELAEGDEKEASVGDDDW